MHELLGTPQEISAIVLRTLVVYLFVLGAFRLSGKREVGQLAPFDFALILLIANSVQNAMVGSSTSSRAASLPRRCCSRPTSSWAGSRPGTGRWNGYSGRQARILVNRGHVYQEFLHAERISPRRAS